MTTYTIGIGALLEGGVFNLVRRLETRVAEVVSNAGGLDQPPHITVKRPFMVKSLDDIDNIGFILAEIASNEQPFDLRYSGFSTFGESVLYLAVKQPNDALRSIHSTLLNRLLGTYDAQVPFEGDDMVFHTSIANNLRGDQVSLAESIVKNSSVYSTAVTIRKVGIFMGLDNNTRWVIVSEYELSGIAVSNGS